MKKQYRETNNEIALEDVSMAAALTCDYYDEEGKHKGLEFLRVQDTPFPDTKEIILSKGSEENWLKAQALYMNKKIRVEPHDYLNTIGEMKDLIKARIKASCTYFIEERKKDCEEE